MKATKNWVEFDRINILLLSQSGNGNISSLVRAVSHKPLKVPSFFASKNPATVTQEPDLLLTSNNFSHTNTNIQEFEESEPEHHQ